MGVHNRGRETPTNQKGTPMTATITETDTRTFGDIAGDAVIGYIGHCVTVTDLPGLGAEVSCEYCEQRLYLLTRTPTREELDEIDTVSPIHARGRPDGDWMPDSYFRRPPHGPPPPAPGRPHPATTTAERRHHGEPGGPRRPHPPAG